jgi:serine/threonine-protein kinase
VTPALEAVIGRCLEKDPQRRFQSISELVGALASLGARSSMAGDERRPMVYGSNPRIIVGDAPALADPTSERSDAQTVSVAPGPDATLESPRLKGSGGTLNPLSSPDSRVEVVTSPTVKARSGSRLGPGLALAVLAASAVAGLWWMMRDGSQTPQLASASAQPSRAAPNDAAPLILSLESEPAGATVSERSERLGTTPFSLTMTVLPDASPRVFVLEKSGYEPYVVQQPPGRGRVHVRAALSPTPRPSAAIPTPNPVAAKARPPAVKRPPVQHAPSATPKAPSDIRLER